MNSNDTIDIIVGSTRNIVVTLFDEQGNPAVITGATACELSIVDDKVNVNTQIDCAGTATTSPPQLSFTLTSLQTNVSPGTYIASANFTLPAGTYYTREFKVRFVLGIP
jgi:hypothetical protein